MYDEEADRGGRIQTLSRLNRTYPGKESTYVLDFVNDPQDVLERSSRSITETATLDSVSDPNLIYDLFLQAQGEGSSPGRGGGVLPMPLRP